MKFMVADVFADPARAGFPGTTGNRAGVVWLQDSVTFPSDIYMARLAARLALPQAAATRRPSARPARTARRRPARAPPGPCGPAAAGMQKKRPLTRLPPSSRSRLSVCMSAGIRQKHRRRRHPTGEPIARAGPAVPGLTPY